MDKDIISGQMDEILQIFKEEIAVIRTGRATPALIDGIEVTVYGTGQKMKLMELGTISVEEARSLLFQPWDKSIINEIKNSISQSDLGLSPIIDSDKIRINLPALTTQKRQDYLKLLGKKLEAIKVMIRNIRSNVRHQLQSQLQKRELSEDAFHRLEKELQELTDEYIGKLETMAKVKEREIKGG